MPLRRLLALILLNILVSASVVLVILFWWDNRSGDSAEPTAQIALIPTVQQSEIQAPAEQQVDQVDPENPPEEEEIPSYTVQAGDTLGKIGREFDVSIEDIMAANGLDNPNLLAVGQVLIIPVGGLITPSPQPTDTPQANQPEVPPTPISAQVPSDGEAIVEIGDAIASGTLEEEAITVVNNGTRPIALLGWRLVDAEGHTYTFGQITLFGEGAAVTIHTINGVEGPADLFWGLDEAIWQAGETATLYDAEGTVRSTYIIGS